MARAAVLMYHRAADLTPDPFGLSVPPALLASQLDAIKQAFRPIGITALLDAMEQDSLPSRSVAVTFDDGYLDALLAADLLQARGISATFFVNTEDLDHPHESWESLLEQLVLGPGEVPGALFLSAGLTPRELEGDGPAARRALFDALHARGYPLDGGGRAALIGGLRERSGRTLRVRDTHRVLMRHELRGLAGRPGMEIGVHGAAHLALPLHPPAVQHDELASAKLALETLLGRPVSNLAYAYGAHDERTVAIAARLGFRSAFTVREGSLAHGDDPLTLPRLEVGRDDPEVLVARVARLLAGP